MKLITQSLLLRVSLLLTSCGTCERVQRRNLVREVGGESVLEEILRAVRRGKVLDCFAIGFCGALKHIEEINIEGIINY
jgi:hypothetical protein